VQITSSVQVGYGQVRFDSRTRKRFEIACIHAGLRTIPQPTFDVPVGFVNGISPLSTGFSGFKSRGVLI